MSVTAALLTCLWVAAHHGLRSVRRDPLDAAPYPLTAWHVLLWGYVHDLTAELRFPPAPGGRSR